MRRSRRISCESVAGCQSRAVYSNPNLGTFVACHMGRERIDGTWSVISAAVMTPAVAVRRCASNLPPSELDSNDFSIEDPLYIEASIPLSVGDLPLCAPPAIPPPSGSLKSRKLSQHVTHHEPFSARRLGGVGQVQTRELGAEHVPARMGRRAHQGIVECGEGGCGKESSRVDRLCKS